MTQPAPGYGAAPPGQWSAQPNYYAQPPPAARSPMMGPKVKEYWMAFVFTLIGMILVIVAVVGAWVTTSVTEDGVTINAQYYVTGTECGQGSGFSSCVSATNLPAGFVAAEALIIIAMILAILAVVFCLLGVFGVTMKGLQAKLLMLFSLLTFPLALAAPFVFLASTYSNSQGFSGMFASPQTAGYGWYCAIVGGVIFLIALLLYVRKANAAQKAATANMAWTGGAPAAGGPPQYGMGTAGYYQAPAAAAPMAAAPVAAAAPTMAATPAAPPICPKCGKPTTYVAQYQRYYCYTDQQYV
ncbi:MAG: hypothetical protein WB947_08065 [Thermoplasmata archaeon]